MKVVYVGCGSSAIDGAINIDNSISVRLAKLPILCRFLKQYGLLTQEQNNFINVVRNKKIKYGNATNMPFRDKSVDIVYSSHTIEHLYEEEFQQFISEAERILKPGGVLRIAIPDLSIAIKNYGESMDADGFCKWLNMGCRQKPRGIQKLRLILAGNRNHKWMYDGYSAKDFIEKHSEFKAVILSAGQTTIKGKTGIDYYEREDESVYLECIKK